MRSIDVHKIGVPSDLELLATDAPGAGGANHEYVVEHGSFPKLLTVKLQNGPIGPDHSVNGVTHEVLLAIVIDRLQCFQAGPFACDENETALRHARHALVALMHRTVARMARGVEGKLQA